MSEKPEYILYIKTCPGVKNPQDFKVGKAKLAHSRTRLKTYQNAVGPVHTEQFIKIWVGTTAIINWAEKIIHRDFSDRIGSKEGGFSEWISNVTFDELLTYIRELQQEYPNKIHDVPAELEPLTMPLCEDLTDWVDQIWVE